MSEQTFLERRREESTDIRHANSVSLLLHDLLYSLEQFEIRIARAPPQLVSYAHEHILEWVQRRAERRNHQHFVAQFAPHPAEASFRLLAHRHMQDQHLFVAAAAVFMQQSLDQCTVFVVFRVSVDDLMVERALLGHDRNQQKAIFFEFDHSICENLTLLGPNPIPSDIFIDSHLINKEVRGSVAQGSHEMLSIHPAHLLIHWLIPLGADEIEPDTL